MKSLLGNIGEIATGTAYVDEQNDAAVLHRFTREQEDLYKRENEEFYRKVLCTAGIRIVFKTDSEHLYLKVNTKYGSSRTYFAVEVFADGNKVGEINNFSDMDLPGNYTAVEYPLGEFDGEFTLGGGTKEVTVYMPWSVKTEIMEIGIDDCAFYEGTKPKKKLLAFGDSITHGYDAMYPHNRYAARLADKLGAEEYNKAIGGEMFFSKLAELKETYKPDYITVAYGTNDWFIASRERFQKECGAFYKNLSECYPNSKIFAITPIWRKDMDTEVEFGDFSEVSAEISAAVADLDNVTVISGFEFVPKDEKYFADFVLHPNDEGFGHYFESLYEKLEEHI